MKTYLNSLNIHELHSFVEDIKSFLKSDLDLNSEKASLLRMIEQVDYLVGKHDDYCDEIDATLSAMVEFDFTKKLNSYEHVDNNLINVIAQGLNMLNEELYERAINKNIVRTLLDTLSPTKIIIVTDSKNNITFAQGKLLEGFKEGELRGKSISTLFDHYELIIHLMRVESLSNNININMFWQGTTIPVSLKIGMSMNLNKIEGIIYIVDLPGRDY